MGTGCPDEPRGSNQRRTKVLCAGPGVGPDASHKLGTRDIGYGTWAGQSQPHTQTRVWSGLGSMSVGDGGPSSVTSLLIPTGSRGPKMPPCRPTLSSELWTHTPEPEGAYAPPSRPSQLKQGIPPHSPATSGHSLHFSPFPFASHRPRKENLQ